MSLPQDPRSQVYRTELEATRQAFHTFLDSLSDADLERPGGNPAWNVREVLYHMSLAPSILPEYLLLIRKPWLRRLLEPLLGSGKGANLPRTLFNRFNELLTRSGGRRATRLTLAHDYDTAHLSALRVLDSLQPGEWDQGMQYPDWPTSLHGWVTVEDLFRYIPQHFQEHADQIRHALGQK